ncbi:MAG: ABC transporter ATP-binding protein [Pyrinomonadaceae bacterium]
MKPAIKVERLSKHYRIGGLHPSYMTMREMVAQSVKSSFRRLRRATPDDAQDKTSFWALKDFNLTIPPGEVVGLIGHNGAGKSTLLKILSRITEPTTGRIELEGRVGSLLEVGTGFHPDLTGRENVYLNGAILGMKRTEIRSRFDEIVAFSEIENFIDTAVKYYSSGMYLRLAFSVAAHLDTEILMMDEVLAVGDVAFQQKCLDKMNQIRQQGRTILFVSHNMPAVTRLCKRAVLLDKGKILRDGAAQEVVGAYLSSSWKVKAERTWSDTATAPGSDVVRLSRVRVRTEDGQTAETIDIHYPVGIEMSYEVLRSGQVLTPHADFFNEDGAHLFAVEDVGEEWRRRPRPAGTYTSTVWIPGNFLSEGNILVHTSIVSRLPATTIHVDEQNVVAFQVIDSLDNNSARGDRIGNIPGAIRPLLNWTTSYAA